MEIDEDLIPYYLCPICNHRVCKDEWCGDKCLECSDGGVGFGDRLQDWI